jgi:hypothetical protein
MPRCYVFDLDGTLANLEHRLWYIQKPEPNWRGFFRACAADLPIAPIISMVRDLSQSANVVIFSGRSDEVRDITISWLIHHEVPYVDLYMRKEGDIRHDHIVKKEILGQAIADGWEPILFVDDRKTVVDMWRSLGYICLQCAPGDF